MFVPPAVLVALGLWADVSWGTKPWLTLAGAGVGLGVAVLLVRAQLRGAA
jgi:Putative F0F1-ATPase subunit Ca2+/Mg2+ transporter